MLRIRVHSGSLIAESSLAHSCSNIDISSMGQARPIERQFPHSSRHHRMPGWQWRTWASMTQLVVRRRCLEIERGRGGAKHWRAIVSFIVFVTKQLRQFRSDLLRNDEEQARVSVRAHKNARLKLTVGLWCGESHFSNNQAITIKPRFYKKVLVVPALVPRKIVSFAARK